MKYVIRAYETRMDGMAGQIYYVGYDNELTENLSECDLYDTEADCEAEIERIEDSFASCWELRAEEVQDYELEELEC